MILSSRYPALIRILASHHPDFIKTILSEVSAPTRERRIEKVIEKICSKKKIPYYQDGMGNVWLNAKTLPEVKKIELLFVAHLDHPGIVIDRLTEEGMLAHGTWKGGGPTQIKDHKAYVFHEEEIVPALIEKATYKDGRPYKVTLRLLKEMKNPESDNLGACLDIPTELLSHEIKARALDDLISVCACIEALLGAGKPKGIGVLLSHSEEIHQTGIHDLLKKKWLDPEKTRIVVVDTTTGESHEMGAGLIIRSGDEEIEYSEEIEHWLKHQAVSLQLPYEIKKTEGRTDGGAFVRKKFMTGSLAIPLQNPHNEGAIGVAPEILRTSDYRILTDFLTGLMNQSI